MPPLGAREISALGRLVAPTRQRRGSRRRGWVYRAVWINPHGGRDIRRWVDVTKDNA